MKNSEIFQKENIHVDDLWLQKITTSAESETCDEENDFCDALQIEKMQDAVSQQESKQDDDHNNFDDIDINHCNAPSVNTLLDEQQIDVNSMFLTYAPGEGKRPIFNEPLAEYLCFPSIFCGQKCPPNEERTHPLQQQDIFKYELHSVDTRVASNIPNIFWKAKHKQTKQITDKVSLAVRRNKTKGKKITARTLLDKEQCNNIVKLDEGYYIFCTIRSSPAYFDTKKKDVMAMV